MAKGHRWRHATGRGDRSRGAAGLRPHRWPRRYLRRQPGGLCGSPGGTGRDGARRPVGRAQAINDRATTRLSALADEVGVIGEIRGRGAMIAVELVKPGTTEPDPVLTKAIAAAALAQGVVILTCGTHGNVIRLLPPLVIGDELLDEGLTVLEDAIRAAAA